MYKASHGFYGWPEFTPLRYSFFFSLFLGKLLSTLFVKRMNLLLDVHVLSLRWNSLSNVVACLYYLGSFYLWNGLVKLYDSTLFHWPYDITNFLYITLCLRWCSYFDTVGSLICLLLIHLNTAAKRKRDVERITIPELWTNQGKFCLHGYFCNLKPIVFYLSYHYFF